MREHLPIAALLALIVLILISGCAGNGQGLDENGNPVGTGGGGGGGAIDFPPTFTNIQQNVFSAICIQCHIGASAPQGLQLDEAHSYSMLVNVASNEEPQLKRVDPGNPDLS